MASMEDILGSVVIEHPNANAVLGAESISFSSLTESLCNVESELTANNYSPLYPQLIWAKGAIVVDIEGNKFYDMLAAYSSQNQGHNHPVIQKVMREFIDGDFIVTPSRAFRHAFFGHFLGKVTDIAGMERFLPMNTGAEAVESAMKLVLKYGHDVRGIGVVSNIKSGLRSLDSIPEIIFMTENFHGRTRSIVGASTDPVAYTGFGPQMPGTVIVPYGDIGALADAVTDNTVGVVLEPIQGEAGVVIPPEGYLTQVRELTRSAGILMCLDEVQTGLGRTGYDFAWQAEPDSKPDIVVMGKALSGGMYPVSGIATSSELMSVFTPGTHGSTYGGNALASMIGAAAVDVIVDEKLSAQSRVKGEYFLGKMQEIAEGNASVKEVRGRGLFTALEFYEPIAHDVVEKLVYEGVLAKDTHETTIRFTPPLVITYEQLDDVACRIERVLGK